MIRLTVLGSCGTYPAPGRACSGYLLEATGGPDRAGRPIRVWVDAGSGTLANLLRYTSLPELDAIWVSHLHVDHCSDLPAANYALKYGFDQPPPPVPVFGPSGWINHMEAFWSAGMPPSSRHAFEVHELTDGECVKLGGLALTAVATVHGIETYGIRATADGRTLAYSADSGPCEALGELADAADLFVCEAAWMQWPYGAHPIHMTPHLAGKWAADADARRLVLTHLRPDCDPEVALDRARQSYGGDIEVAVEQDVFQLGVAL